VTYRRVLDWLIGFIDTLYIPLGTTVNYSAITISTSYRSHRQCPQSSLVGSWQQIHNGPTVNFKSHVKSSLHSLIPFLT
jgi:hypothetical protein